MKVTDPAETPVTTPALVTVAIVASLLNHVPPVVGLSAMLAPTQRDEEGALTAGGVLTLIVTFEAEEAHGALVMVHVNM